MKKVKETLKGILIVVIIIVGFAVVSYFDEPSSTSENDINDAKTQREINIESRW